MDGGREGRDPVVWPCTPTPNDSPKEEDATDDDGDGDSGVNVNKVCFHVSTSRSALDRSSTVR